MLHRWRRSAIENEEMRERDRFLPVANRHGAYQSIDPVLFTRSRATFSEFSE